MAEIKCIDVSEWQGDIDWKKVKASGLDCVILRAGFGRAASQKDSRFDTNYKNAKDNGIKIGVYWYSYAENTSDAEKEAAACLSVLNKRELDMPVFYDLEDNSMTKLSRAQLTAIAKAFCEKIKAGGYRAGVYSNPNWFKNYLDYKALKKLYPIWLAQYYTEPQYECDIWQYSSSGKVSGITGSVDLDLIYSEDIIEAKKTTFTVKYDANGGTGEMSDQKIEYGKSTPLRANSFIRKDCTFAGWAAFRSNGRLYGYNSSGKIGWHKTSEIVTVSIYRDKQSVSKTAQSGDTVTMKALWVNNSTELYTKGDINGDGKVNVKDVTELQKLIAGIGR